MHLDHLRQCLESFERAKALLQPWALRDLERGWRNLGHLAEAVGIDTLTKLVRPLGRLLPRCADPDMALNNLERLLANPLGAQQLPA
jgi:glutamate-ammonia-ligase adenylyltransferase